MEQSNPESYVADCFLSPRAGETLFTVDPNVGVFATLRSYAVIPIEEYLALTLEKLPLETSQYP